MIILLHTSSSHDPGRGRPTQRQKWSFPISRETVCPQCSGFQANCGRIRYVLARRCSFFPYVADPPRPSLLCALSSCRTGLISGFAGLLVVLTLPLFMALVSCFGVDLILRRFVVSLTMMSSGWSSLLPRITSLHTLARILQLPTCFGM